MMRLRGTGTALWLGLLLLPARLWASDAASLQFTVPAPDPVQAGESMAFQALAVNTGDTNWAQGSFFWVAEVYDLEYRFLARSKEISPTEAVAPGGVAAISLPFEVPMAMLGRKVYRVFLIKDAKTLVQSDYKPFQVMAKELPPAPPPPEAVDYRVQGNVTVALKDTSQYKWRHPNGTTSVNVVGKIKQSSYLINAYLIHEPGKVVDPYILLFTYYAPWGRVYAGDISPTLSALSVNGQGLRGLMLEQSKGAFDWTILGGQSVTSQAGNRAVDGRFSRSLYAGHLGWQLPAHFKAGLSAFLSADETSSLSSDPDSPNYRGPTLVPQKNQGVGLNLEWTPAKQFSLLLDYQKNDYFPDSSRTKNSDTAYKIEAKWSRKIFKLKVYMQRAGPKFVAFSAPGVIGDRLTYNASFNLTPVGWYGLNLGVEQYSDNLAKDSDRTTATQTSINVGNSFQFKTGTSASLTGSLNKAKGKPVTALDNQTTSVGLSVSQKFKKHSVGINAQTVQFRDKNHLANDLDTQTFGFNTNLTFPWTWRTSLGASQTQSKDKTEGSKRTSLNTSASCTITLNKKWSSQYWTSLTQTKNTSPTFPGDTKNFSLNAEYTWTPDKHSTLAFGPGYNDNKDKYNSANSHHEIMLSMRYSYSF